MVQITDIKGSMMMSKITDIGNMIIMISASWCNKWTRCSMMIGEGVTIGESIEATCL